MGNRFPDPVVPDTNNAVGILIHQVWICHRIRKINSFLIIPKGDMRFTHAFQYVCNYLSMPACTV